MSRWPACGLPMSWARVLIPPSPRLGPVRAGARAGFAGHDDVVLVTKFGHPAPRLSPGTIKASIELSRANLRRDRIDLALFHVNEHPPAESAFVFDTLAELRDKGWIGAFGWSTDARASAAAFADRDGFVAVENDLNVFDHADDLMRFVAERNLVSLGRLPLAMGLLSGKYTAGTKVGANDIRAAPGVD